MASLFLIFALIVVGLVASAAAIARGCRLVGAEGPLWRKAIACATINLGTSCAVAVGVAAMPALAPAPATQTCVQLALVAVQFAILLAAIRAAFRLSWGRAFAPLGAHVATSIVAAGLALYVVRPHLVESFVLPTRSMAPTVVPGDRFTVNKLLGPRRWDLIAYRVGGPRPAVYLKRLVALPGERLRFESGTLYINDRPAPDVPAVLVGRLRASADPRYARYAERETIALGPDEYFVIGDDVDRSVDSRVDGPVRGVAIVGVADWIYWPPSHVRIVR